MARLQASMAAVDMTSLEVLRQVIREEVTAALAETTEGKQETRFSGLPKPLG